MKMAEKPRKKPDRRWRDPSSISSQNTELEILNAIDRVNLQRRWPRPDAISFARRALEVALKEAINCQAKRSRDQFDYWQKVLTLSSGAGAAIKPLIQHIELNGLKNGIDATNGFGHVRVHYAKRKLPNGDFANRETNTAELALLVEAYEAIKAIKSSAKRYAETLTRSVGNEREHDKHIFVYRLAEAWIYLTGKLPGLGRERNPFLRFVEAAGTDAGIDEEDFYSATKQALEHLKKLESFLGGSTDNKQTFLGIRKNGPQWLR
jgi:hypothetical protein